MSKKKSKISADEFPNDWKMKHLGEIATISTGGTPSRGIPEYWGGNIPWITTTQIDFNLIEEADQFITGGGLENSSARLMPKGTMLMALYGQGKTRGKVAVLGIEAATNQACAGITLLPGANADYVFQFLVNQYDAIRNMSNTGNQENLNGQIVKSIPLFLPNEPEQRAIAAILRTWDNAISLTRALIAQKQLRKRAFMQQLLTGKRRLPGFAGKWKVLRLKDETDLITKGTTPTSLDREFTNSGVNFIKIESLQENGDIVSDKVAFIDETTHNLLKRSQLKENDILISIAGALGRIAVVHSDILPANTNQALAIVRLKSASKIDLHFLFYYLNGPAIRKHIDAINVQAAQANLSLENVGNFMIALPSDSEQRAIATVLETADRELKLLNEKLSALTEQKKGLMQKLLTGEWRVNR